MSENAAPARYSLGYRLLFALAISLLLLSVIMTVDILLHPLQPEAYYGSVVYRLVGGLIIAPLTILVGVLCIRHSPGNVVGVLLMLAGAGTSLTTVRADADPWLINTLGLLGVVLFWTSFVLILLHFPDGRPYFRRAGAWMGRAMLLVILLSFATQIVGRRSMTFSAQTSTQTLENPFFVAWLEPVSAFGTMIFPVFASIYLLFVLLSLIARYRAAGLRERQQLKWFLWGFAMWMAPQLLTDVPGIPEAVNQVVDVYSIVGAGLLPIVTVAPAILLNRLWDIDIVIRRTLVYGVLTAVVALAYWSGVVGLQAVLRPFTGEGNDLAVVATTLVVATLVLPLRRWVQGFIDRRFYRRKYDADRTLASFGEVARDEVDLDALTRKLVDVVQDTMQPAHISLWLQSPEQKEQSTLP